MLLVIYHLWLRDTENHETEYGGIAQLGERLNGIQEVSGSIPLISTKKESSEKDGSFLFVRGTAENRWPLDK